MIGSNLHFRHPQKLHVHLPRPKRTSQLNSLWARSKYMCLLVGTGDAVILRVVTTSTFFRSVLQLLYAQILIGQHGNLVIVTEVEALNVASLFPTPHVSVDNECRYALLADTVVV